MSQDHLSRRNWPLLFGNLLLLVMGCHDGTAYLSEQQLLERDTTQLLMDLAQVRNIQTCDGRRNVRGKIAQRLGEIGDPQAIASLITVLNSPDEDQLSPGASGCEPGRKNTYPDVMRALAQFGPQAQSAQPRLLEMLTDPETNRFTPTILDTLMAIAPSNKKLLSELVSLYVDIADTNEHQAAYFSTFKSFGPELSNHAVTLAPTLQQIDINAFSSVEKGTLLTVLLYSGVLSLNPEQLAILLSDVEALRWVELKAFHAAGSKVLPNVLLVLENFETKFPESELVKFNSWCGPQTLVGLRNSLRGRLLSILNQICTPEAIAAVKAYKQQNHITITCESTLKTCQPN